jgi:hypothetical protein
MREILKPVRLAIIVGLILMLLTVAVVRLWTMG